VVLFFYPKDSTSGCTRKPAFQEQLPKFKPSRAVVFGYQHPGRSSKAKFADRNSLTFSAACRRRSCRGQEIRRLAEEVALRPSFMGIARTTYLIGGDGTVVRRWTG